MIILQKVDEVYFYVSCEPHQEMELKAHLTYTVPNHKYMPKYKSGLWDGKITFFNIYTKLFPIGLFSDFIKFCKAFNYEYDIKEDEKLSLRNNITDEKEKYLLEQFDTIIKNKELRDYQSKAVIEALKKKRGLLLLDTGSGKSLILYCLVRYLLAKNKQVLLVVPSTMLVEQMYTDFKEYGWEDIEKYVDKLYEGHTLTGKPVLISTWQSIYTKKKPFFERFGGLLVDECHGMKSSSLTAIGKNCINCDYRIGTTGTLQDDEFDRISVKGMLGPVLTEVMYQELNQKGVLANIKIYTILLQYPPEFIERNKYANYHEEVINVCNYEYRNTVLDRIFKKLPDKQNSLILCQRRDHLEQIEKFIEKNIDDKYTFYVIHGNIKTKDREVIRKLMEQGENTILLATYGTLSTGVNIKKIHNVIFASPYKSKIKVLQSIGRGLRMHKDKEKLTLFDLVDDLRFKKRTGNIHLNHCFEHYKVRKTYYKQRGYDFKIVKMEI